MTLLLHITSVVFAGVSGYLFGHHFAKENLIPAAVCLTCMIGACVIAQVSMDRLRKDSGKRDSE